MKQGKVCASCGVHKSFDKFYKRSGHDSYTSECKACMKARSSNSLPIEEPRAESERIAIEQLQSVGIYCTTGKATAYKWTDVVAFGCVRIEVKYAHIRERRKQETFKFSFTPKQQSNGLLADVIMLICDDFGELSFHLFPARHSVFYMDGRLKSAVEYNPYYEDATHRHHNNRVILTPDLMFEHEDNYSIIWRTLKRVSEQLKASADTAESKAS